MQIKNLKLSMLMTLLLVLTACYRDCEDQVLKIADFQPKKAFLGQDKPKLKPMVFGPEIISTSENESNLVFNANGTKAVFVKYAAHKQESFLIYLEMQEDKSWKKNVMPFFQEQSIDRDPFLSPSGDTLYFSSNRNGNQFDIFYSVLAEEGWQAPINFEEVNGPENELNPILVQGAKLYFLKEGGAAPGIYTFSKGEITPVDALFPSAYIHSFTVGYFDQILLLSKYTAENSLDLHISFKENKKWGVLEVCNQYINTKYNESTPFIDFAGDYIFFSSDRIADILEMNKNHNVKLYTEQIDKIQNGRLDVYWMMTNDLLKFYKRQGV